MIGTCLLSQAPIACVGTQSSSSGTVARGAGGSSGGAVQRAPRTGTVGCSPTSRDLDQNVPQNDQVGVWARLGCGQHLCACQPGWCHALFPFLFINTPLYGRSMPAVLAAIVIRTSAPAARRKILFPPVIHRLCTPWTRNVRKPHPRCVSREFCAARHDYPNRMSDCLLMHMSTLLADGFFAHYGTVYSTV